VNLGPAPVVRLERSLAHSCAFRNPAVNAGRSRWPSGQKSTR
jgi:hypothetical protein